MSRFIRQDGDLQQIIKQVVKANFPAVDISSIGGPNVESFSKNSVTRVAGSVQMVNIVENNGTASNRLMLWSTSRWGGSHVVK